MTRSTAVFAVFCWLASSPFTLSMLPHSWPFALLWLCSLPGAIALCTDFGPDEQEEVRGATAVLGNTTLALSGFATMVQLYVLFAWLLERLLA